MIFSETPNLLISQRFARAEGVGLGECKARTAKQPQGPERKQPSKLSSFTFPLRLTLRAVEPINSYIASEF